MTDAQSTIIAAAINAAILFPVLIAGIPFARWLEKGGGLRSCLADCVKIITKRTGSRSAASRPLAIIAPAMAALSPIAAAAFIPILPISETYPPPPFFAVPHESGLIMTTAMIVLGMSAPLVAGWSSRSAFAMLGGLRSPSQMMNTSLPLIAALISLVVSSGSLDIGTIIIGQGIIFSDWYVVRQPVVFLIVCFATLAASMRPPFDAPHCRRELIAGYMMDANGGSVVLFTAAHYLMLVVGSLAITALFLGGGFVPGLDARLDPYLFIAIYVVAFAIKTLAVIFFLSRLRRIVARMRLDQIMHVGWKIALPLAAFNLVITVIVHSWGV